MKKIKYLLPVLVFFAVASYALAASTTSKPTVLKNSGALAVYGQQIRDIIQATKQEVGDIRTQTAEDIAQMEAEFEQEYQGAVDSGLSPAELEQLRADFQALIVEKLAETDAQVEALHAEMKEQIAQIKDERKRAVAERLMADIQSMNYKMTGHFVKVLDNLTIILGKVSDRAVKASVKGSDVSGVVTAVEAAKAAIQDAQDAAVEQAGKVYEFDYDSEEKVKESVSKVRDELRADLKEVQDKIAVAREAIKAATQELIKSKEIKKNTAEVKERVQERIEKKVMQSPSPIPSKAPLKKAR